MDAMIHEPHRMRYHFPSHFVEQMLRFAVVSIVVIVSLSSLGCARRDQANRAVKPTNLMARQIKIDGLEAELRNLQAGKTEYDFIGITSNGVDCIYFVRDGEKFQIEFEAMMEDQVPYIEKLDAFGKSRGYSSTMTTYGNKPLSGNASEAPVIRIMTHSDLASTAEIGSVIQKNVFGNDADTLYDVVP